MALDADPLIDPIPAEGPILSRNQQLPLSCGGCALEVTRLVGNADVIIWTRHDIISAVKNLAFGDLRWR